VPKGFTSTSFTVEVLTKAGVVLTPGSGFGAAGEGYVRAAITVSVGRIREAVERIKRLGIRGN
jgi:LL-diaminopimelate aminotransferase